MASMRDAMVRNLKGFVDEHLTGQLNWDKVRLTIPAENEGDVAEITFAFNGSMHVVRIESSDHSPPAGRVLLNARDMGPIYVASWEAAARALRGRVAHEVHDVRHGFTKSA